MVSFHMIDVPTQHHTPAPSTSQPLSPSAPPALSPPLGGHTMLFSEPSSSSSASLSLDMNAPTSGCLLAAAFGACLISGLTFQWVIEKGLFRKAFRDKTNQYNVIVSVTAMATLLQTIACFVNNLLEVPNLFLTLVTLISWIFMTHGSVMIVSRKVSLTYNNAEQAWQRLLYINAAMMVVSIAVCVVWIGAYHGGSDHHRDIFKDINRILEPTQICLWGALELALSAMFIVQMRKYFWKTVERKGILTLLVVALCDTGLVCLNVGLGDWVTACVRGFVYALRIRLELEVLSAMVTYIQNKRKEVVYMAHEQRKRRRRSRRNKGGGSSNGGLDDDSDASGSQRSSGSLFHLRRRRRRKNSGAADFDDNDSVGSYQSLFNLMRRKRRKNSGKEGIDDDDDSTCSHMSVFHRLPHATDFSNIFQRNFLQDFAAATQHSGNFISSSLNSLGKKCRDIADHISVASARSLGTKGSRKKGLGSATLRTQTTVRNSTSSCEIPIQGMEIKLAPSEIVPELGEDSDVLLEMNDMEEGTDHCRRQRVDMSNSLHVEEQDESQQVLPFYSGCASVSDIGLSADSIVDSDDSESSASDSDSSEDTPHLRGSFGQQPEIPNIPVRQQAEQSSDDDGDDEEPMMFGIPRCSFQIKDPSDLALDVDDVEEGRDDPAPFGILRQSYKSKTQLPTTPSAAASNQAVPPLRRCVSLSKQELPELRRSTLHVSRLHRIAQRDQLRRQDSKEESEELLRALDELEKRDCL